MDKKYAIFDMDGTLIDSMGFWKNLGREYLAKNGITDDVEEVLGKIKPMTMTESAQLFCDEFHLKKTAESIAREMNDAMDTHYREDIPLKKGAEKYLKHLFDSGVKMCVASATDLKLMEVCLSRLGVAKYFEFLLSCEEVGAGKNHPDVYFEAARRLESRPEDIAVYEDAAYAIKTAVEAGFYTIAVHDSSNHNQWEELKTMTKEAIYDYENSIGNRR